MFFSPGGDVKIHTKKRVGKVLFYFPHFTILYRAPALHQSLCQDLGIQQEKDSYASSLCGAQGPAATVANRPQCVSVPGVPEGGNQCAWKEEDFPQGN